MLFFILALMELLTVSELCCLQILLDETSAVLRYYISSMNLICFKYFINT